jgi:beta-apo-4'-carotenal oxygenase
MEKLLAVRYPPFAGTGKFEQFAKMSLLKPDFDREGRKKVGMLTYLFTLGSGSAAGGALRAGALAALAVAAKLGYERKGR